MARRGDSILSVLGGGTRGTGRIHGGGGLRVEGQFVGDVTIDGAGEITQTGHVEGDVRAASLEVRGTLVGNAETEGPVRVRATATVRGELAGSEISIEPGARVSVALDAPLNL